MTAISGSKARKTWPKNNFSLAACTGDKKGVLAKTCIMSESQDENICVRRTSY